MKYKKIVIPNCEVLSEEEYEYLIRLLEECPLEFQVWESDDT